MNAVRSRLTYANVMATIAVFAALGGTGYAAISLPKGSVGPKQLKKSAVTAKKIKRGAVGSVAVKDGGLKASDFAAGQVPAGPKGDKGDKGDTGAPGSARAYAYLNVNNCPGGNVSPCQLSYSKGFSAARRTSLGSYCLAVTPESGIVPDTSVGVATVDWTNTSNDEGNSLAMLREGNGDCDANEVEVETSQYVPPAAAAVASNFVSFYIGIF